MSNTNFIYFRTFFIIFRCTLYNTYVAPKINPDYVPNDEFNSTSKNKSKYATLYLFSTNWCPYSKKVKPVWNKLKSTLEKTNINDYILNFINIDGDKDKDELTKFETDTKKKIEGYPTIILMKDNQIIEFEAKPDENTLTEFIHSVL